VVIDYSPEHAPAHDGHISHNLGTWAAGRFVVRFENGDVEVQYPHFVILINDEMPANITADFDCGDHLIARCRALGVQAVLYDPVAPHGLLVAGALGVPCVSLVTYPGMGAGADLMQHEQPLRRAMEVCFALMNPTTVRGTTRELLLFMETCPPEFKGDCASGLTLTAEKYSPNARWHVETLFKVLVTGGNYIRDDTLAASLVQRVSSNPKIQSPHFQLHINTLKYRSVGYKNEVTGILV